MSSKKDNYTCSIQTENGTSYGLVSGYSGIPENLAINSIYFGVAFVVFLFVRRHIRDQDRESTGRSIYHIVAHPKSITELNVKDLNPLTIVWKTITLSLNEIGQKCGPDSTRYLYFQLHLIPYSLVLCAISMIVIFPINIQGTLNGNISSFGFSTLSNLPAGSSFLWAPIICNAITTIIGIFIMAHFVFYGNVTSKDTTSKTTLMIRKVQPEFCNIEKIRETMRSVMPDVVIEDITIAYNTWTLSRAIERSQKIRLIVEMCNELEQKYQTAGVVYHCCCGYVFSKVTCHHCCKIKQSDAYEYYNRQFDVVSKRIDSLTQESLQRPTGIVFLTFSNEDAAARALDFIRSDTIFWKIRKFINSRFFNSYRTLSVDQNFERINERPPYMKKWRACYAPKADNINWENVKEKGFIWWFRLVTLNACLFWLSIVLTTPSIVLNTLDKILSTTIQVAAVNASLATFIVNVLPPLFLKMISKVLPPVIGHSAHLERHLTRSHETKSHIHKSFVFLLFTTLIIPSLGLTGINGFLRWLFQIDSQTNLSFQWQCIFLPDNGAFFVNYVITSALIGTATSLLRIPELIAVGFNLLLCRSKAEELAIYKLERAAFTYCSSYASLLTVFAVVNAYSIICPLITVFGVLYFILHYYVDKYNIYFVAAPTLIKQRIHLSAFRCSMTCLILPQIFLLIFMALKSRTLRDALFIVQAIIACVFILMYMLQKHIPYDRIVFPLDTILSKLPRRETSQFIADQHDLFQRYYPHYLLPYINDSTRVDESKNKEPLAENSLDNSLNLE